MAQVDFGSLLEQSPLGFQLHAADEQVPAVAHVGAHGSLHRGRKPQADQDGKQSREVERVQAGIGDAVDQSRAQIDGDGRHRRAESHPARNSGSVSSARPPRQEPCLAAGSF